jgi:hypothetical protein
MFFFADSQGVFLQDVSLGTLYGFQSVAHPGPTWRNGHKYFHYLKNNLIIELDTFKLFCNLFINSWKME